MGQGKKSEDNVVAVIYEDVKLCEDMNPFPSPKKERR